jgi:hypothetical protein
VLKSDFIGPPPASGLPPYPQKIHHPANRRASNCSTEPTAAAVAVAVVGATSQTEASVSQHIAVGRLRSGVSLGTFSAADGHRLQFKIYLHCCAEAWWLASSSGSKPFIPTSQSSQRSLYLEQINKTNADRDAIFSPSEKHYLNSHRKKRG